MKNIGESMGHSNLLNETRHFVFDFLGDAFPNIQQEVANALNRSDYHRFALISLDDTLSKTSIMIFDNPKEDSMTE